MATLRQIAANRLNAQKSTGPKTEEGKAQSCRNALVHGISGDGVVLPDEQETAFETRMRAWLSHYPVIAPEDDWLFQQIVVSSIQLDHCRHHINLIRHHAALRASLTWNDDRRLEAETLFASLARKPELVSRRLLQTRQGCEAAPSTATRLRPGRRNRGGEWTDDPAASLAFDLLGTPADFRGRDPLEQRWLARRRLVNREIRRLRDAGSRNHSRTPDEVEREAAAHGIEVHTPPSLARALGAARGKLPATSPVGPRPARSPPSGPRAPRAHSGAETP